MCTLNEVNLILSRQRILICLMLTLTSQKLKGIQNLLCIDMEFPQGEKL